MATAPLRIAVVDDHHIARSGIAAVIHAWPHGKVVLEAANGLEYERACATLPRIHIAIVDLCMPVRDGYETMRWIRREQPITLPIALTFDPHEAAVLRALECGARAVLNKTSLPKDYYLALDHVSQTGFHYNDIVTKALRKQAQNQQHSTDAILAAITEREMEFLRIYARPPFLSLKLTAEYMGLRLSSAESLRKQVVARTGFSKRHELSEFMRTTGLL